MVLAVRDELREQISALSLSGVVPKLYVGVVADNAAPPFAYLRRGGETPLIKTPERYEATVYLDLYARSSTEVQLMENAASFLDDYNPAPYGNAAGIRYFLASKTQLSEGSQREHSTLLYAVRYHDLRRLIE